MVERINQIEHDSMVRSVANYLKENGHSSIKADLEGYEKPELIYWSSTKKGHYPDVTSNKSKDYIFEVETDDTISELHTGDQWKLFSESAKIYSKAFIVVVPKESESKAWDRVTEMRGVGVTVDNVWTVGADNAIQE
ncbi:hypothetical protein ACFLTG_02905 [Chloroflexota bacterium]